MIDTKKFRIRHEIKSYRNPRGKDFIIGLDVGYSGTKAFYEDGYFCFPSYAKRIDPDQMLDLPDKRDIFFRDDENGEVYIVGYNAQSMIEDSGVNDPDGELYSRYRYGSRRYRVICYTAIGMALMGKKDSRKVVIQTGLPSSFIKGDKNALVKALSIPMSFSLKIRGEEWKSFHLKIEPENIYVMAQPAGALYSVLMKNDGSYTDDAMNILRGKALVMDGGFGTFDFYGIQNRSVTCQTSLDDVGMRGVLNLTSEKILQETGEDICVAALQKNLETGVITCLNEEELVMENKPLAPMLEAANEETLEAAKQKIQTATKSFRNYDYLIIDGGTGEAWYDAICYWLQGLTSKGVSIIPSNRNDGLPFIYSNARGYYLFRYAMGRKK